MLFQIGRTGDDDQANWRDSTGDKRRIGKPPDSDGGIKSLRQQVSYAIVIGYIELKSRVGGMKYGQERCHMAQSERQRQRDPKPTRDVAVLTRHDVARLGEVVQNPLRSFAEFDASFRWRNTPRRAI